MSFFVEVGLCKTASRVLCIPSALNLGLFCACFFRARFHGVACRDLGSGPYTIDPRCLLSLGGVGTWTKKHEERSWRCFAQDVVRIVCAAAPS